MAREIGKARRADLSGHFAGEQHDALAPLVRFLVGARQLNEVEEGKTPGSGDTSLNLAVAATPDTEAYPPLMSRASGNGHNGNGHAPAMQSGPEPEPELSPPSQRETDIFGDEIEREPEPASLEAAPDEAPALDVAPASASDTVHDDTLREAAPEPQLAPLSLDSTEMGLSAEPEITEPDAADTAFDLRQPEPAAAAPEAKTRILTPKELKREAELSPEDDRLETGKLKLSPADIGDRDVDEETSVVKSADDPEKITTKVDPNSAAAKAPQGGVVRDTVNFYNQTQALRDLLDSNQRPVPALPPGTSTTKIPAPGKPISTPAVQPLAAQADDEPKLGETLEPDETSLPPLEAAPEPAAQPVQEDQDEQTRAFMRDDLAPALSDEAEAPDLAASDDSESAERKDTDRFRLADLRPADLPVPEGTDRIEKPPAEAGEPVLVAPEQDAARRDTQKFFVSDLMGIASFKPAPKPVPLAEEEEELEEEQEAAGSAASTTSSDTSLDRTSSETEAEPRAVNAPPPLPRAREVVTDFIAPKATSGTRIVPELPSTPGQRLTSPKPSEKITEKVKQEQSQDTDKLPPPARSDDTEGAEQAGVKKITDALTRRMRQERDETRKLIDEAEGVLLKLRQTPVSVRAPRVEAAPPPVAARLPDAPGALAQPAAAQMEGLPPLDQISSATIHDLRLAEELLQASKAISAAQSTESRASAVLREIPQPAGQPLTLRKALSQRAESAGNGNGNGHASSGRAIEPEEAPQALSRIEQRLGGAAKSLEEIFSSTSAALRRVTGEITREELEERRRAREEGKRSSRREAPGVSVFDTDFTRAVDDEPQLAADPYEGLSLEELLTAASSLRHAVSEHNAQRSGRRTASGRSIIEEEPLSRRTSARLAASALASELERMRAESARRSTRMQKAQESAKIPREDLVLELTQGPLWQTLVGIGGVTLFLTGLFIWVWYMAARV